MLPDSFYRVRHYGLLANCVKAELLVRCRRMLGAGLRRPQEHGAAHRRRVDAAPLGRGRDAVSLLRGAVGAGTAADPASGARRELRPRTVPGVRGLEQFLNGGLPMGHPRLLRDIFQACIPRPPGRSAPTSCPRGGSRRSGALFLSPSASASVRLQALRLGHPAANRQFLIPFPAAVG